MKVLEKYTTWYIGKGRIDLKKDDKYCLCRCSRWLSIHSFEEATKKEKEEMKDYVEDGGYCDFIRFQGTAIPISSMLACGSMYCPEIVAFKENGILHYISAFCDWFDMFRYYYVEFDETREHARFYMDCE